MIGIIFVNPTPEHLEELSSAQIVETITAIHIFKVSNESFEQFKNSVFLRELPNIQLKVVTE